MHLRWPGGPTPSRGHCDLSLPAQPAQLRSNRSTDQGNAAFQVSMQGDHTCPECGRCWAITATAAWADPAPPVDPEDDIPSEISAWHYSEPWHVGLACQHCDYFLERVTLDNPTESSFHVEDNIDGPCPVCAKPWRISYTVSWDERPGGSAAPGR